MPEVDAWTVVEGAGPFTVFGTHDAADNALIGRMAGGKTSMGVILDGALAAATNSKLGASSVQATILTWNAETNEYEESPEQVLVWNHSEHTSHGANTFGVAKHIDGHYWFFGDCDPMADREAT